MVEALSLALQEQKPKKMCLQAMDIQIKLFDHTSIFILRKSWLEFVQKQQGYRKLLALPCSLKRYTRNQTSNLIR